MKSEFRGIPYLYIVQIEVLTPYPGGNSLVKIGNFTPPPSIFISKDREFPWNFDVVY